MAVATSERNSLFLTEVKQLFGIRSDTTSNSAQHRIQPRIFQVACCGL